nr:dihydroneopterin aldolase 1-like [Ipomoea batatas]
MAIQEGSKCHDHKKDKGKAIMLHGFHVAADVGSPHSVTHQSEDTPDRQWFYCFNAGEAFPVPIIFRPSKLTNGGSFHRAMIGSDEMPKGDKLVLRGLKFYGYHGVKPEERTLGQKFVVDVDAWMDLRAAGKSDQLSDTLSYTDIYSIVKEVVEGSPHNLLESVAEQISSTTLSKYPQVNAVRVHVGKPHVSVKGPLDYLGVEIIRYRGIDI